MSARRAVAISFGLMLAPLTIRIIVLAVALRRADRALSRADLVSATDLAAAV